MSSDNPAAVESCYFIRLKTHVPLYAGPPIPESLLAYEIKKRGWDPKEVETEPADLKFLEFLRPYYDSLRR